MKKNFLYIFVFFSVIALSACSLWTDNKTEMLNESPEEEKETVLIDGEYELDLSNSFLNWEASRLLSGHKGQVSLLGATINIENSLINPTEFRVDMNTISDVDGNENLVKHLKSADFFDVENNPESVITINSINSLDDEGNYLIDGDLTIKGITNPVSFPAKIYLENGDLKALAEFSIDRTLWDIKYQSASIFSDLGDKAIKDLINFKLDLLAKSIE